MENATINASTRLIKVGAPGEDNVYPLYLYQVRAEHPDTSFPDEPLVEWMNSLGYFAVEDVEKPVSQTQVVEEGAPVFEGGVWKQTWVTRDYTAEEQTVELTQRRTTLLNDIASKTNAALETGYEFDFQDGKAKGHIQLRDGDRANLAGIRLRAQSMKDQGVTTASLPFRDQENATHMCTPDVIIQMSDAAYVAYQGILAASWQLKDQVVVAETLAALPVIPDVITPLQF